VTLLNFRETGSGSQKIKLEWFLVTNWVPAQGQSEPTPMTAPVGRSVHRMGWMIRLFFIRLFTLRFFWLLTFDHFFLVAKIFPTLTSILPTHRATLLT
jgi:hypothetical protein